LDNKIGPLVTAKADMRARWQLILDHAPKKHDSSEVAALRAINKRVRDVTADRNIVVHGLIHKTSHGDDTPLPPCWSVFRGEAAGKSFPVSTRAVVIIHANIYTIAREVRHFNNRHGYERANLAPNLTVETEWPKLLER
jgi:hypothetical protein